MSHFAFISEIIDGKATVENVLVIDQEMVDTGNYGDPSRFIQTSYNTIGNKHNLGGTPLRGNYAGVGSVYDAVNDVFYSPQPFASWTLNQSTWEWKSPVEMPTDGKKYKWHEDLLNWLETPEIDISQEVN
jgi:hypothetical protein